MTPIDTIHLADALTFLQSLPDDCIVCAVSSPPYFRSKVSTKAIQVV